MYLINIIYFTEGQSKILWGKDTLSRRIQTFALPHCIWKDVLKKSSTSHTDRSHGTISSPIDG